MREKAAVYARYSSHSQTEQSIEGQLAAAKKYAEEHDYTIVKAGRIAGGQKEKKKSP